MAEPVLQGVTTEAVVSGSSESGEMTYLECDNDYGI